jgi:hypothetical protein
MRLNKSLLGLILMLAAIHATPSMAISFVDGTFALSNYSISTYQTGGATIQNEQTLTGGDPGAAAQIITSVPAGNNFTAFEYWLNTTFIYVPATQGVITSIDVSADLYFQWSLTIGGEGLPFLIKQGTNLYVYTLAYPTGSAVWESGSKAGLKATDFSLVTDLTTLATDSTKHPNFSGEELDFGFVGALVIAGSYPANKATARVDNLSFVIHSEGLPTISSLQPNTVDAGSPAFTLTVNGSNFASDDTVKWNGVALATTFVSASKLTAKVSAAEVAAAGSAAVTVVDSAAGNQTSEPALFAIPLTTLVINSQSIKTNAGAYSITLTLSNSGYNTATDVLLTGAYLATTASTTTLPIDIASFAPRTSKTVTLSFPSSAGKAGAELYLVLEGSFVGGGISLISLETVP